MSDKIIQVSDVSSEVIGATTKVTSEDKTPVGTTTNEWFAKIIPEAQSNSKNETDPKTTENNNTPSTVQPENGVFMFQWKKGGLSLDIAALYMIGQIYASSQPGRVFSENVYSCTEEQLMKFLYTIDWLEVPWGRLPKAVFDKVFSAIAHERLAFFCGRFCNYYDGVQIEKAQDMKNALWNAFKI
jgi:hypothetical protein